jgi:hypothetical protein
LQRKTHIRSTAARKKIKIFFRDLPCSPAQTRSKRILTPCSRATVMQEHVRKSRIKSACLRDHSNRDCSYLAGGPELDGTFCADGHPCDRMASNSRTWFERIEQELLPTLNFAVLLIPVVVGAMQLGSAAAGFVAATRPTDVAKLETPSQPRDRARSSVHDSAPQAASEKPGASAPSSSSPRGDRSLTDPLLGYGI